MGGNKGWKVLEKEGCCGENRDGYARGRLWALEGKDVYCEEVKL